MTPRIRLLLTAIFLVLPLSAHAALLSVTGIEAREQDGQVHVRWQKLPEAERIILYRVVFSPVSIVRNNGASEGFDIAMGTAAEHILTNAPQVPALFVSVVAMNEQGQESIATEEVTVSRTGIVSQGAVTGNVQATDPQALAPAVPVAEPVITTVQNSFTIRSAEAISATGVLLTFSAPVDVRDEDAAAAFTILDGSGQLLELTQLIIIGNTVTLLTAPQEAQKIYKVTARHVQGMREDGVFLPLDSGTATILFMGYGLSAPPAPSGAQTAQQGAQSVRLRAEAQSDGRYTVEAQWGTAEKAVSYALSQTLDHGRTFGPAQSVPIGTQGIRIPDVPAGEFGLRIQGVGADNEILGEATAYIQLGTDPLPMPQVRAEVFPQEEESALPPTTVTSSRTNLTQTGISTMAIVTMAGVAGGVAVMRRRRLRVKLLVAR